MTNQDCRCTDGLLVQVFFPARNKDGVLPLAEARLFQGHKSQSCLPKGQKNEFQCEMLVAYLAYLIIVAEGDAPTPHPGVRTYVGNKYVGSGSGDSRDLASESPQVLQMTEYQRAKYKIRR